jgi:hypothetical protein
MSKFTLNSIFTEHLSVFFLWFLDSIDTKSDGNLLNQTRDLIVCGCSALTFMITHGICVFL